MRFEFEFRRLSELIVGTQPAALGDLVNASLFVDYVYLDAEERKKFATSSHEYLIEQVQFTGDESVTGIAPRPRLNFNHPCKALYWVLKLGKFTSGLKYLAYGADINAVRLQATKRFVLAMATYTGSNTLDLSGNNLKTGLTSTATVNGSTLATKFTNARAVAVSSERLDVDNIVITGDLLSAEDVSTPINTLFAAGNITGVTRTSVGDGAATQDVAVRDWANYGTSLDRTINPISTVLLQLNGHDRFSSRDGNYFNYVQPWQHHTNTPSDGVNMYSFALNPEEHQPSGTCNMSRIDNATLNLNLKAGTPLDDSKLAVYALNFNVFRVLAGMGKKTAHKSRLPLRFGQIPQWENSLNCPSESLYNRLVDCLQSAILPNCGKFLRVSSTIPLSKGRENIHSNDVGYSNSYAISFSVAKSNNLENWIIRSQAPKGQCHDLWRRFREQTEVGKEMLTTSMTSLRCAPFIDENQYYVRVLLLQLNC